MKKLLYISLLMAALLLWGCYDFDELNIEELSSSTCVVVLEDGKLLVSGTLSGLDMTSAEVATRGENTISSGWCLIFGGASNTATTYSDDSPLLQKLPITVNAKGEFTVTLIPYEGIAFLRILVNLTTREKKTLENVIAWADIEDEDIENYTTDEYDVNWLTLPTSTQVSTNKIATFGEYTNQSVGLDGIYNFASGYSTTVKTNEDGSYVTETVNGVTCLVYENINQTEPNPTDIASAFPMSSIGFAMNGITEETVKNVFETKIYMVRVCSKMDITIGSNSGFTLKEVYMINCAQESRLRSTVLSQTNLDENTTDFGVPVNLGDTIDYLPLVETKTAGETTSPIYFYPNSGGDYNSNGGAVNQDINPQYVIFKGRAAGYDTDGYYKIALKAKYPIEYEYDTDNPDELYVDNDGNYVVKTYSAVTYDILRNTHFNINLIDVDKPGYKTLADAEDDNAPASNISYDITILSTDGRNEILISNGTYYVELQTTRVYMAGYGSAPAESTTDETTDETATTTTASYGNSGSIDFTIYPNTELNTVITTESDTESGAESSTTTYTCHHPAVYVQADYGVNIESCFVNGSSVSLEKIDLASTTVQAGLFDPTSIYYDEAIADAYGTWGKFAEDFYDSEDTSDAVHDVWYKVKESDTKSAVTVNYSATYSGRVRLRIGDMLKFIPVQYISSLITKGNQKLTIADEIDFAYDEIKYLSLDNSVESIIQDLDGSYSWFSDSGWITENNSEAYRELRAMIYPSSSDGITKLYFKQNYLDDGVIYLIEITGTYTNDKEILEYVIELIDSGVENLVFEGDEYVPYNVGNLLDSLQVYYADSTDVTYSVDISGVTFNLDSDKDADDGKWTGDGAHAFFQYNTNLVSVVMPSNIVKTDQHTFIGCTNLEFVTFGGVDDPLTEYSTTGTLLNDCSSMIAIVVYTTDTSVKIDKMSSGVDYFDTKDGITYTVAKNLDKDNGGHVKQVVYKDGVLTGTLKGDDNKSIDTATYVYIFCTDTDLQTYYQYLGTDGVTYYYNTDVYTLPYTSEEYIVMYNNGDFN